MQSAVETLSPTRVRLTVEVPFAELKPELDKAYKTIGAQVKVQGFRPGKVPPRILDQRVGRGVVLEEAVQEALPRLYSEAVTETGVSPVGRPEVDVTKLDDGTELTFTAEVDVRPEFDLPAYDSLAVTVEDAVVTDEDVTTQVDELRERFAKLIPVERAAADGDYVTLDLVATVDGEDVPGGTAQGLSYQLGAGDLLEGIDEAVTGKVAGDATSFSTTLVAGEYEGRAAEVAVTLRAVNDRELPAADDTWAETTGFATFVELWDRGQRAREEGRPGPFAQPPPREAPKKADAPDSKVLSVIAFKDPMREMEKLHTLYDSLMDARRQVGDDVVPFHRFAALVKDQVTKLRETGTNEVAFRVAMKEGKVNFTVRGLKGPDE